MTGFEGGPVANDGYRGAGVPECARALAAANDPDPVATLITEQLATEVFPDRSDDAAFVDALDDSVRGNVRTIFSLIQEQLALEDANPAGALAFADVTAELGIPVSSLDRAYRVGTTRFWSEWFDLATDAADGSGGSLSQLVRQPSTVLFSYIDRILGSVVSRYDATREDLVRTRQHLRRAVLTQILEGAVSDDPRVLEQSLSYRLGNVHLALVIEPREQRRVESDVAVFQEAAGAQGSLLHHRGPRTWIAWIARPDAFTPAALSTLGRALGESGARVAVGEPAVGLDGLRQTYREALEAARVQRALDSHGKTVVWFKDVRLEAFLLGDAERARQFVTAELGPLAGDEERLRRIRETLLSWMSTGTHVGAAATLDVHQNTVRNRIRQAEELLPGALVQRRTELQVALRLERVLHLEAAGAARQL